MPRFALLLAASSYFALAACGSDDGGGGIDTGRADSDAPDGDVGDVGDVGDIGDVGAVPVTIKVASELPLQGSELAATQPVVDAIKLAVKDAGDEVAGYKIVIEIFDDALNGVHDPETGAQNMQKIVDDAGFVAVIGPFNSSVAQAQIPVSNEAGLFQCSPSNTNPALTKPELGADELRTKPNNYVRVATTDDLQGPAGATYVFQSLDAKSVYIIDDAELFGAGIADTFQEQFEKEGGTVVKRDSAPRDSADYAALAEAAAALGPEAVFFGGVTSTGGAAAYSALVAAGLDQVPFVSGDGIVDGSGGTEGSFINLAGDAADGDVHATIAAITDYVGKADFTAHFEAEYGEEPAAYTPLGYACAQIVLDAIGRAAATKPADPAALRAAVRTAGVDTAHEYTTILGKLTFDANGDTSQKFISIYSVDPAAGEGEGDWVFERQIDFGAAASGTP